MDFQALALVFLFLLWAALGSLPWLALALWRRGRDVLALLPLAIVGGIGGGLLVPALGAKDGLGMALSLVVAVAGGLALTLIGLGGQRLLSKSAG